MRGKIKKLIAAVLTFAVLSLAFTITIFAGDDDSYWYKCQLDLSNPMANLWGTCVRIDQTGEGNDDYFNLNLESLVGSGHNDQYGFFTYYWQPFKGWRFDADANISVEFRLQYSDYSEAILQGFNQCRRLEMYSSFYVSGQTLYNYSIDFVNGGSVYPLYFEAIKTQAYLETPVSYWCDFEIDPSAYFSISFDMSASGLSNYSYLYLYIYDSGNIIWLEKPGYEESIKNQQTIGSAQDKLDQLGSAMNQPPPDIDQGLNVIIGKEDDLSSVGSVFTGKGTFYAFVTSLMIVGVSLGMIGYVLHGKK